MQTGALVCPCINSRRRHLLPQSGKEQVKHNPEQPSICRKSSYRDRTANGHDRKRTNVGRGTTPKRRNNTKKTQKTGVFLNAETAKKYLPDI
jgi:hypothetical protein